MAGNEEQLRETENYETVHRSKAEVGENRGGCETEVSERQRIVRDRG